MKTYTPLIFKAIKIAHNAHSGQFDKSGIPYIFHPVYLASQMDSEAEIITALLHDVVEDTSVTLDDLAAEGFTADVLEAVEILTHTDNSPYFDYINRAAGNPIARKVKLADLKHNSNPTRTLPEHDDAEFHKRIERYTKAIKVLEEAENRQ
jgi:(p)ppGpp synthase/HD superfamily hydrolase